ncbi:STAS domain-containing protein [Streptomyces sp. CC219B]|uniref:STAS domain-containing protein n=1 Tax=Streptomyces sp. CC219B TaxID=3044574 RepID=UPI0024A95527|nr:STAS domain-containing protein [Streptomyces sp. CC219B]
MFFPLPTYRVAGMRVIEVHEALDLASSPRVLGELERLVRTGGDAGVVVDLPTACLTSTGVEALEHLAEVAARRRRRLCIAARRPLTRRVLSITGADQVLAVHPDLAGALGRS